MKEKFKKIIKFLNSDLFIMELFFLLGIIIFIATNFAINIYFGMYTLAFLCIVYSIFVYKTKKEGGNK